MENQAYVVEDQSRAEEQSPLDGSHSRNRQPHVDTIDDSDSFVPRNTTYIGGHVYEDISTATEDITEFSEQISFPDESGNTLEIKDRRSANFGRQAWISGPLSIVSPVLDESFQHSSTLSSSAGISANCDSATSTSSKTSDNNPERGCGKPCNHLSGPLSGNVLESVFSTSRENEDAVRDRASAQPDRKPNRRRKKKDCKHCRSKLVGVESCEKLDELAGSKDAILKENRSDSNKDSDVSNFVFRESLLRPQNTKIYPTVNRTSLRDIGAKRSCSAAFPISKNGLRLTERFLMSAGSADKMLDEMAENNQNNQIKILGMSKNGTDMRINSIYSQNRWYGKELPIFYTDVKDQNHFQRAYSLPTRTHTPTSQNRVNLRRSVRNDPPPHPARLDKHRRGWTLHLARPLKAGCSSSLVALLIILLLLLGIAGVALYIVFEPKKLEIIQQYLKSSTDKLTGWNVTSGEHPITSAPFSNDELNLTITTTRITTPTSTMVSADAFTMTSALLNGDSSFLESESTSSPTRGEAQTEATSQNANATRYCDDCFESEVCVALVDEQVPICRSPRDHEDPTGCAGFCVINKQKCHRLDVDAFRCVEIEHYCLDDEWICSNMLCIPLDKRCDGHMNCYDHSDEYDCVCNLETHFQCSNETSCLPLERRCDGKIDCWDATDEINCTLACPLDNEFTCSNGECILKTRFCDRLADCSDGSDEPHGCQGRCNKHEFTCQNGRCVTKGMKCNGIDDCGDGTDERHCKDRFT